MAVVHLLAPGLFGPMPVREAGAVDLDLPLLQRLLARADRQAAAGHDLASTLTSLCGIAADGGEPPLAALRRLGDGAAADDRYWLELDPVFLRPDQDRLLLFDTLDLEFTLDEAHRLAREIEVHFADEGWRLERPTPHRWYLALDPPPQLRTAGLTEVIGRNMDLFLPGGEEGVRWRARLNEIQMLFHASPVNRDRESRGMVPVNGVWVSGGGRLAPLAPSPYRAVYGDDPLTRGVARAAGVPLHALEEFSIDEGKHTGALLVVFGALLRPTLRADPYAWREQLDHFQAWLASLIEPGGWRELLIHPCDGRCYRLIPAGKYRFWRLAKPYSAYLDSEPRDAACRSGPVSL